MIIEYFELMSIFDYDTHFEQIATKVDCIKFQLPIYHALIIFYALIKWMIDSLDAKPTKTYVHEDLFYTKNCYLWQIVSKLAG